MIQSQLMNSVHLLTATSQGVQHWAGYQQHVNLMFEVFGENALMFERLLFVEDIAIPVNRCLTGKTLKPLSK